MSRGSVQTDKHAERLKLERQVIDVKCQMQDAETSEAHICSRSDGKICTVYAFPSDRWRVTDCPMADSELKNIIDDDDDETSKVRVGQQKQKKHR